MTMYGSFTPYLVRSSSPDLSSNTLPPAEAETFDAAQVLRQTNVVVPANYASAIQWDLSYWTSITAIKVTNTGTTTIEVDWESVWSDGTSSGTTKVTVYCPPGRTIIAPNAEPVDDINGAGTGTINIWGVHLTEEGLCDVVILGT